MIKAILDLFFPPLCLCCQSVAKMPYLCRDCWMQSSLIDPEERCLHCFEPMSERLSLCLRCRKDPFLPFPRASVFDREAPISSLLKEGAAEAIAGFAYYQWQKLDWKEPDCIVPLHPSQTATQLAALIDKPCPDLLRRVRWPAERRGFQLRENWIEEDAQILLFDEKSDRKELQMACAAIAEAFPKRVYVLSLLL